jgi:thiol-disulfide isomerase/thioredoxin
MAVVLADDASFSELLQNNEKVVVKYYADWCGSCKLFAPKFRRLSEDDRFSGITFVDVNAEKSHETRKLAGVSNLPYFAIFDKGSLLQGVATAKEDAVVELLQKLT